MPSTTDLANDALGQIGAEFITNITDGTTQANLCQRFLDELRDALIRRHRWNFAVTKKVLNQEATGPVAKWAYAYALPSDCLRVLELGDDFGDTPWQVERVNDKKCIVTDETTLTITYLARVTDPNKWDVAFYQALATHLASKLASGLLRNVKLATDLYALAESKARDAEAIDGQEGFVTELQSPTLTDDVRSL